MIIKFENPHYNLELSRKLTNLGVQIKQKFQQEYRNGIKTGRFYGNHRASAPGETPAKITGNLGRNFKKRVAKDTLFLINESEYGYFLEFGTRRVAARNGVYQALQKSLRDFEAKIVELES